MPRGGLDKFHQVPGAPQKMSRRPSPPTTGNRKTGTLRQDRLSIASADAGTFRSRIPTSHGSSTSLHGLLPATQQHLTPGSPGGPTGLCGCKACDGSPLPSGYNLCSPLPAMAPLPVLTSASSSGGPSSLLLKCHSSADVPAFAFTSPPTSCAFHFLLRPRSYPFPKSDSTCGLLQPRSHHVPLFLLPLLGAWASAHPILLACCTFVFPTVTSNAGGSTPRRGQTSVCLLCTSLLPHIPSSTR